MSVVKSGYLRKHSKSILSGGWNRVWVVLHQDTNLIVYKKQGDSSPMGTINMFEVRKWFAYGEHTGNMNERPSIPAGASLKQVLAIPQKPSSKAKVHWFLADSESDLHEWMNAICKVLPPPPQKESSSSSAPPPVQYQSAPQVSSAPPPYHGGMPAPGIGFDGVASGPAPPMPSPSHYPQQAPYPQTSYPQQQPGGYYQPPQTSYPQQTGYPQQNPGYPQQQPQYNYGPPPPQQQYGPPPPAAYPQQQYHHPQGGYYQQPPATHTTVVYQQQPHRSKGILGGNSGNMALGLIGGAALGYGASRMMGGGMYGMYGGWGHGSWSSLSSFGSCGSFGSFGSF